MKRMTMLLVLPITLSLTGCASWGQFTRYPASPQIYGGVRLHLRLMRQRPRAPFDYFLSWFLVIDFPFSLGLDTALLPVTVWAPRYRWEIGREDRENKAAWDKEKEEKLQLCNRVGPGVVMKKADLRGCDLRSKDMRGADLSGADLRSANVTSANLTNAKLDGVNLTNANLEGANLEGAELRNAFLYGTNLMGSTLTGANLTGANLAGANLQDADLRGSIGVNLENAIGTPAFMPDDPLPE